uniref:DUF7869 domain-containing protein n=2 Tax=Clytia hemisphaerica TaxID=252671 RepID=A0A7M5X9T5_9CNID
MDQQKTYLPHFKTKFKNMPNDLLKVHVSGAISHGTQEVFMFLNGGQWSGDSNLTCNIITEVLLRMTKDKNTLPPVLYIQLDNCWSENKNQFVMAFCALLVGWRLVDKVRLSFLMVGHTHEDIDQTFSNISGSLKTNDAKTMSSLVKVIEGTFKRKPTVVVNEHMDDYKTMLGPHIFEPSGHTGPHAFKFEWKNEKVVMSSKEWSASGDWSEVGELLDVDDVVNAIQINPPSFAKICLAKIKSVVNSKKTEQVMTKEEREEWTRFVEKSIQKEKMYQHPSLDLSKSKGPCSLSELGTQSPKERKRNLDEEARFSQLMEKHNKKISKVYLDR